MYNNHLDELVFNVLIQKKKDFLDNYYQRKIKIRVLLHLSKLSQQIAQYLGESQHIKRFHYTWNAPRQLIAR